MNKKGFILIAGIIFIVILCLSGGDDIEQGPNSIIDNVNSVGKIKVAHMFVDGTHMFTGEINLPTPCHTLEHKVIIAKSFPEQATIVFESESEVDSCVQMIMPEPFFVSFDASKEAVLKITFDGENVPFEIVDVEAPVPEEVTSGSMNGDDIKDDEEMSATSTGDTLDDIEESAENENVSTENN